jgi:hypothetical protein
LRRFRGVLRTTTTAPTLLNPQIAHPCGQKRERIPSVFSAIAAVVPGITIGIASVVVVASLVMPMPICISTLTLTTLLLLLRPTTMLLPMIKSLLRTTIEPALLLSRMMPTRHMMLLMLNMRRVTTHELSLSRNARRKRIRRRRAKVLPREISGGTSHAARRVRAGGRLRV